MSDTNVPTEETETPDTRLVDRLAELGVRVETLRDSDAWRGWLEVARRFHRYSFGNQLLIAFQMPHATQVAGYRTWQQLGRQVVRGEHGIKILRPRLGRRDPETGERNVIGFGVATIFDVSQTTGEDLPAPPPWPFAGGTPMVLFEDLAQQVTAVTGLDVYDPEPSESPLRARGWYDGQRIAVRSVMFEEDGTLEGVPAAQRVKTLLHELGHHFDPAKPLGSGQEFRADAELVAESVAWVTGTELGLDLDATVEHYLASWEATPAQLVYLGRRITKAVGEIEALLATEISVPVAA